MGCNRKQGYLQHKKYNMSILEQLLAMIAPHACIGCRTEGALLCTACVAGLPAFPSRCYRCGKRTPDYRTCRSCRASSGMYQMIVASIYDGLSKELVHKLKFARGRAAAYDMAQALAICFSASDATLISHIPTAPARVRQRGYDQAALIARALAQKTGVPYTPLLARLGDQRQVGRTREQRRRQMQGVFRVTRPELLNQHVLLVDDVLTTGATCEAAAQALRKAGAKRVSAAVFAAA